MSGFSRGDAEVNVMRLVAKHGVGETITVAGLVGVAAAVHVREVEAADGA
jgi:hypothetical protein